MSENPNPASALRFLFLCFTAEQQEGCCSPQEHPAGFAVGCLFKCVHLEVVVICIGFLWLDVGPEGKELGVISLWHCSDSLDTTQTPNPVWEEIRAWLWREDFAHYLPLGQESWVWPETTISPSPAVPRTRSCSTTLPPNLLLLQGELSFQRTTETFGLDI